MRDPASAVPLLETAQLLTRAHFPKLDFIFVATGNEEAAVRREGDAVLTTADSLVWQSCIGWIIQISEVSEGSNLFAGFGIPKLDVATEKLATTTGHQPA